MSKSIIDTMSPGNAEAMLEYLFDQLDDAETKEDVHAVLELTRQLLEAPTTKSAVQGLDHVRVEYGPKAPPSSVAPRVDFDVEHLSNVVNLEVPQILTNTFQALSERMKTLQSQDPETFANASSALSWLANGELTGNQH